MYHPPPWKTPHFSIKWSGESIHSSEGRCWNQTWDKGAYLFTLRMTATMKPDASFQPSNSVDLLQSRSRKVAEQSLKSTQRMVVMVDESKDVGVRTFATLDKQGEKMNLLDEANEKITEEIKVAENNISRMEALCGICNLMSFGSKVSNNNNKTTEKNSNKSNKAIHKQPQKMCQEKEFSDGFVPRITHDEDEEQMDGNLAHVHSVVGDLKSMAAGINAEVKAHNRHLDKISRQTDNNDLHIQNAAQRTDKLHH